VFVRDGVGFFTGEERAQVEEQLRDIASRTGVYGIVVAETDVPDPPVVIRPIVAEVTAAGGELLLAICTSRACDLTAATAYTDGLRRHVEAVAPVPEPIIGSGPNDRRTLRRWVEFVGAVATLRQPAR
jgi:hypothetical protein